MRDVFISYARPDRDHARRLVEAIRAHGWSVWCDRVVPEERQLVEVVEKEFATARCVLILWSNASVNSERVFNEAMTARRQRRLMTVLVEDAEIPDKFHRTQPVDVSQWSGDDPPARAAFIEALEKQLGPPRGEGEPLDVEPVVSPVALARIQSGQLASRFGLGGRRGAIVAGVLVIGIVAAVFIGHEVQARRATARNDAPIALGSAPAPVAQAVKDYTAPTDDTPPEVGWTADSSGCKVWNPHPRAKETMTWSGACVHNRAYGPGVVEWSESGQKRSSVKATWREGKPVETEPVVFHDFVTNETYEGRQEDGQWVGKVVVTAPWGRIEGPIANGAVSGYVTLVAANGRRYEGEFSGNKFNGRGVLSETDGTRYVGGFVDGLYDGKGTLTWPDRSRYEGDFSKGRRTGKGSFVDSIGGRYAGDFVDGRFHGTGVLTTKEGKRHEGRFVAGQFAP